MKKKVVMLLCLMLAPLSYLAAQNVVSGTVTDSYGNPLPGAKVEVMMVGASLTIMTEANGTFQIQTMAPAKEVKVSYDGMLTMVQAVTPDMHIRLVRMKSWNQTRKSRSWIISPQVVFPEKGTSNPAFGLMVAKVNQLGWYAKFVYAPSEKTEGNYEATEGMQPWTSGKDKRGYMAGTAGLMYCLKSPIYVYAGLGYVDRKIAWQLVDGTYVKNTDQSYSGVVADYGLMLRWGALTINGGALMSVSDGCNFAANFGVGFSF